MLIKIEDIPTVPISSEALRSGTRNKHRDISWLCIDAQVYSWCMMGAEDVDDQLRENVDHRILELKPFVTELESGKPVELEYDEVCLLTVHDPVMINVLFNTRAYICNEKGDTVEKIVPKRVAKVAEGAIPDTALYLAQLEEPPCLKCAKKSRRLMKDGVCVGTYCKDCGNQFFEDWESPRVRRS